MSRWPDLNRTRALVIGTSLYENYPDVSQAAESARRFKALISKDVMWGLDPENVEENIGRVTQREAANAILRVTGSRARLDTLLVYICGHGQRWLGEAYSPDDNLHFAFTDSDPVWPFTHLPFLAVKEMMAKANAKTKLLIIDCCYAAGAFMDAVGPEEHFEVPGAWTIVPTKSLTKAVSSWPLEKSVTAFSGALMRIIENDVSDELGDHLEEFKTLKYLTPDSIFRALYALLVSRGMPEPDARGNGIEIFLCHNRAYQESSGDIPREMLVKKLDEPNDVDLASYARAVQAESDSRDGERDPSLIELFCEKRPAADAMQLAAMLRATSLNGEANEVTAGVCRYRCGQEIAFLIDLLHRQDGIDLDVEGLLAKLKGRPDNVLATAYTALRASGCGGCWGIADRISDSISEDWPWPRLAKFMAALPAVSDYPPDR
jgi:hypothetical protein